MNTNTQTAADEINGYYGMSVERAPLVLEALRQDPSLHFQALDARFDKALFLFDPSNSVQVRNLVTYFPEASVIAVVRGRIDKVMSMSEYAQAVRATPSESSDSPGA